MTAWIANLPLRHKFVLLCLLALLMAAAPSALVVRSAVANLAAIESEQEGMQPSRDLLSVIKLMQEHRGLSNAFLSGDASKKPDLAARRDKLGAAVAQAQASVDTLKDKTVSDSVATLAKDWQALAGEVSGGVLTPAESVRRHTVLVNKGLLLLEDVAAVSGLSLDPDAERYFLIQTAFRDLPRLTEQLGLAGPGARRCWCGEAARRTSARRCNRSRVWRSPMRWMHNATWPVLPGPGMVTRLLRWPRP